MKQALSMFWAGVLLMGVGCSSQFGNVRLEADVKVNEKSLDVALDEAAAKLQQELQRRLHVAGRRDVAALDAVVRGEIAGAVPDSGVAGSVAAAGRLRALKLPHQLVRLAPAVIIDDDHREPWFAEVGDVHGNGNLIIFTDGSISDLNTVAKKPR